MSDVKQEAWECKSCGNDAPCRVEVMFEETEYQHIEEQPRFAKWYWSFCVCSERHDAKWTKCIDEANYAALLSRHTALVEAVAWEREAALHWEFGRIKRFIAEREALESMFSSRSEVDRLIAEREG